MIPPFPQEANAALIAGTSETLELPAEGTTHVAACEKPERADKRRAVRVTDEEVMVASSSQEDRNVSMVLSHSRRPI
jgi:5-deoxy-D-glucuronate isomerase